MTSVFIISLLGNDTKKQQIKKCGNFKMKSVSCHVCVCVLMCVCLCINVCVLVCVCVCVRENTCVCLRVLLYIYIYMARTSIKWLILKMKNVVGLHNFATYC